MKFNKKFFLIASVILVLIVVISFFLIEKKKNIDNKSQVTEIVNSFYNDYVIQINTNKDWIGFVDKYSIERAKDSLSIDAMFFINSANKGSQYILKIVSPVSVRFYEINKESAQVLVDFKTEERVVGDPIQEASVEKFIILKKVDSFWKISEVSDRTERFNEQINLGIKLK